MKQRFRKCLGAMIPALMLGTPLLASSARSISRLRARTVAVKSEVASGEAGEAAYSISADPFAVFGNGAKPEVAGMGGGVGSEVLDFLKNNNLLRGESEAASTLSGELDSVLGRKDFAHVTTKSHCHTSGGWVSFSYTQASCVSRGGTWNPKPTSPVFEDAAVSTKTATSFNLDVDVNQACTVYALLLPSTSPAPTSAEVKSNVNKKSVVVSVSPFVGTISFTGLTAGADYRVYVVGENAGAELTPTPVTVDPTFAHGTRLRTSGSYVYPKVTSSPNGNFYMAYWDNSNGRYTFDKWSSGGASWASYTTLTGTNISPSGADGFAFTASSTDASTDNLHMVYGKGSDFWAVLFDPYYALYNGSTWTSNTRTYDEPGGGVYGANLTVDASNKAYITYSFTDYDYNPTPNTGTGTGDHMRYTNSTTAFPHAPTDIQNNSLAASLEMGQGYIVRDSGGTVTIVYGSEIDSWHMNYYLVSSTDSFAGKTLVLNSCAVASCPASSDNTNRIWWQFGNMVIDGSNKIHMVYSDKTNNKAYYRTTNESGNWVETEITATGRTKLQALDLKSIGSTLYIAMNSDQGYFIKAFDGTNWYDGKLFQLEGYFRQLAADPATTRLMIASEVGSSPYEANYLTGLAAEFVTVVPPDTTPPTVSSINRANADNTNAASVDFTVTLSESVTGVDTADFSLTASGTASGTIASVTGSGATYTVTVNSITGAGTLRLDLKGSGTGIADGASNPISGGFTSGQTYTVDRVAPEVSTINRANADNTNAASVDFTVTFSESVTGVDTADFSLTASGTASGTIASVTGSGATYTVTVNSIAGAGTLRLDLKSSGTGIADGVSNPISGGFTGGQTYTVDRVAPEVSTINRANADNTNAASVDFTVTFSESVTGVDTTDFSLTASGTASGTIASVTGSGATYTVTVNSITGAGTLRLDLKSSGTGIADGASNPISGGFTGGQAYTVDRVAPTVISVTSTVADGTYTTGKLIPITVTFSENVTVSGGPPHLTLETGATDAIAVFAGGSGTTTLTFNYTVAAGESSADLDYISTTALALNSGTIRDSALNDADLTLATPGTAGSLGTNKAIVVTPTLGVSALVLSGTNVYAGQDGAGIWRSTDSGATWSAATTQPANLRIKGVVIHPSDAMKLFSASYGSGVFASSNSGDSWSSCGGQPTNQNAVSLAIDPAGILYVGTEGGIFTSNDCNSWNPINTGLTVDPAKPPVAIAVDPANAANLYAGLDGAGVFRSSNSGATWIPAATQPSNLRVKAMILNPGESSKLFAASYGAGIFTSTDSGDTWSACANTDLTNLNVVSISVDAGGKLYAGTEAGVFRSTDGCVTWTAINGGLP